LIPDRYADVDEDADTIVTLDVRHFRAVRPKHRKAFRLLP
jgi:hypothetical protein